MKLVSFGPRGSEQPGVLVDGDTMIVPLAGLWQDLGQPQPDMNAIVGLLPWLREQLDEFASRSPNRIDADRVRLGPPVARPSQIILCSLNLRSQLAEAAAFFGDIEPRRPPITLRPPSNIRGPRDLLEPPAGIGALDYEAELAVVIGRTARNVESASAIDCVGGYMCAQDIASRTLFRGDADLHPLLIQPTLAHGVDSLLPTGPWLATPDEISQPDDLAIRTWVDDELRQEGSTSEFIVSVPELISWLSGIFTLVPGDIILTGTPAGVAGATDPAKHLSDGQVLRTEITGLGEMSNRVAAAPS